MHTACHFVIPQEINAILKEIFKAGNQFLLKIVGAGWWYFQKFDVIFVPFCDLPDNVGSHFNIAREIMCPLIIPVYNLRQLLYGYDLNCITIHTVTDC